MRAFPLLSLFFLNHPLLSCHSNCWIKRVNRGITIIVKECVCQDVTEAENIWAPKLTYESRLKKKQKDD